MLFNFFSELTAQIKKVYGVCAPFEPSGYVQRGSCAFSFVQSLLVRDLCKAMRKGNSCQFYFWDGCKGKLWHVQK